MTKGKGEVHNHAFKAVKHDELDNDSTTDTLQWCELHRGHCKDVVPVRRCFDDPNRKSEMFMACQHCISALKKAKVMQESKYAGLPCVEIIVPEGLSKGRKVALSTQSFEVTLDALQVKYLRALGLQVIPA